MVFKIILSTVVLNNHILPFGCRMSCSRSLSRTSGGCDFISAIQIFKFRSRPFELKKGTILPTDFLKTENLADDQEAHEDSRYYCTSSQYSQDLESIFQKSVVEVVVDIAYTDTKLFLLSKNLSKDSILPFGLQFSLYLQLK